MAQVFTLLLSSIMLSFFASQCCAGTRVALLVGNSNYSAVAHLTNPSRDILLVKTSLLKAGFDSVDTALDLDRAGFLSALNKFRITANGAEIALIYFAGHGLEMNGTNYLVPTDAKLESDGDVADEAISLDRILEATGGATAARIAVLDACRNNPFLQKMVRRATRAATRGLGRVEIDSAGILVAFSAKEGTLALDGDGANSPFAMSFAKRITEPGVDVEIALRKVGDDVRAATGGKQEPFKYGSLGGGEVSLFRPLSGGGMPLYSGEEAATAGSVEPPSISSPELAEPSSAAQNDDASILRAFEAAKSMSSVEAYDAFIEQYPDSDYTKVAIRLKTQLKSQKVAAIDKVQRAEEGPQSSISFKGKWVGSLVCDNGQVFQADVAFLAQSGMSAKGNFSWTGSNSGTDTFTLAPNPNGRRLSDYIMVTSAAITYDYKLSLEGSNVLRGKSVGSEGCSIMLERY